MNRQDIIDMIAKVYGVAWTSEAQLKDLERFAALVASAERERTWFGLTDEEIVELHHEIKVQLMGTYKTEDIYRAIEAKLKEKNNA